MSVYTLRSWASSMTTTLYLSRRKSWEGGQWGEVCQSGPEPPRVTSHPQTAPQEAPVTAGQDAGALGLGGSWSVTLGKLLHVPVPQFLHLYNEDNRTHLKGAQ